MQPATPEEVFLFTLMGQALLNIQALEDALTRSITLKGDVGPPRKISYSEVDDLLKKRQKLSLGQAIGAAMKMKLYGDTLQNELSAFLDERNWFVHKSIDDFYTPSHRMNLVTKLRAIAIEAHRLQRSIEDDLIAFSESNGLDMSAVKQALKAG